MEELDEKIKKLSKFLFTTPKIENVDEEFDLALEREKEKEREEKYQEYFALIEERKKSYEQVVEIYQKTKALANKWRERYSDFDVSIKTLRF